MIIHTGLPTRFNNIGACGFQNNRGTRDRLPYGHRWSVIDRGMRGVFGKGHGHRRKRVGRCRIVVHRGHRLIRRGAQRLCADHLEHDPSLGRGKAEPLLMHSLKVRLHRRDIPERHLKRLVRSVIAQVRHGRHRHVGKPLIADLDHRIDADRIKRGLRRRNIGKWRIYLHLAQGAHLCQTHTER